MSRVAKKSELYCFALAVACIAYLTVGTTSAHAADAPTKTEKADKDDKPSKDEKDAKPEKTETPDQWAKRIELLGMRGDDSFAKEKADFIAKNPDHPARWSLRFFEILHDFKGRGGDEAAVKAAKDGMAEIMAAKDADATVRERSSMAVVQLSMRGASPEELTKLVSDHIAAFPDSKANGQLANMVVSSVARGDKAKAAAALEKLSKSDVKEIAQIAEKKLAQIKVLLDLQKSPLEMKFTAIDSREVDLEKLRGKVVLVDFWATWCGPCVAGLPEVIELNEKYHDKGLEVIGISFDSNKDRLEKFVEDKKMAWPQYFDGKQWENVYGRKYGIDAIPCMWLIGKDGKVIDFDARQDLPKKLAKLLDE